MFIPDSIEILFTDPQDNQLKNVDLLRTGIAWESDKKYKFKNPELGGKTLKEGWLAFVSLLSRVKVILRQNVSSVSCFKTKFRWQWK